MHYWYCNSSKSLFPTIMQQGQSDFLNYWQNRFLQGKYYALCNYSIHHFVLMVEHFNTNYFSHIVFIIWKCLNLSSEHWPFDAVTSHWQSHNSRTHNTSSNFIQDMTKCKIPIPGKTEELGDDHCLLPTIIVTLLTFAVAYELISSVAHISCT